MDWMQEHATKKELKNDPTFYIENIVERCLKDSENRDISLIRNGTPSLSNTQPHSNVQPS